MIRKVFKELIAEDGLISRGFARVDGTTELNDDTDVDGDLDVTGSTSVGGDADVDGAATVGGQTTIEDDIVQTDGTNDWSRSIEDGDLVFRDDAGDVALRVPIGDDLAQLVESGGVHEIDVTDLSGDLADRQDPKNHESRHHHGGPDELDASDLSGSKGDEEQVLTTDGTNVMWETPGEADTEDLRFAVHPTEVDPETRDEFYTDFDRFAASYSTMNTIVYYDTVMDEVSTSSTAMDAVSTSSTAMDAVSVSDLALDAIWDSQDVGWAAVKDVSMAVGKFAVGRAGLDGADYADMDAVATSSTAMDAVSTSSTAMDAVSTSSTAMDAVSTSSTAMDAVSVSILARSAAFGSAHVIDTIWSEDMASTKIWEGGDPTPPEDFTYHEVLLVDSSDSNVPVSNGNALRWEQTDNNNDNPEARWDLDVDFSNADTLEVEVDGNFSSSQWTMKIWVGNDELLSSTNESNRTVTLDVSSYDDVHSLGLGGQNETHTSGYMDFGNIELS